MKKTILGPCETMLDDIEDESIDALVTDPPFGIGFLYDDGKEKNKTPQDYWDWFGPIYEKAYRKVKPGGFIAVWQTYKYMRYFWDWFGEDITIYISAKNFVQLRPTPINLAYDPIVMKYKEGAKALVPESQTRSVNYFVASTHKNIINRNGIEKGHPCPRPLDQCESIIQNYVVEGGTVLDPFAGSGMIGLAAKLNDRGYVLIEQNPEYYEKVLVPMLNGQTRRSSRKKTISKNIFE